mgnify:CR=1 FL=1
MKILNVANVDMLMLRDSPDCDAMQAQWEVLQEALAKGTTRSIGVINYCEGSLKCLLETVKVKPAINYYMDGACGNGTESYAYFTERVEQLCPGDKLTEKEMAELTDCHG